MRENLKDRVDYLLQEWVNINSHASHRKGVSEVLDRVVDQASILGFRSELLPRETKGNEGNSALRVALDSISLALPLVTLVARADTVFTDDSPFQLITWTSGRKRAIGPGVLDNKSGILTGLLTMEKLSRLKERRYRIELLILPGDDGFTETLRDAGVKSTLVLGLSPAEPDGAIVHSRRGWRQIQLKSADTFAFADLAKLSAPERGATVTAFQEDSAVMIDVRYDTPELRDRLQEQLLPLLEGTDWRVAKDYPPLPLNPETMTAVKIAVKLIEHHEKKKVTSVASTEPSLCNFLARPGIPIVDGLGATGSGARTQQETVEMSSIFTRADIIADLIGNLIS